MWFIAWFRRRKRGKGEIIKLFCRDLSARIQWPDLCAFFSLRYTLMATRRNLKWALAHTILIRWERTKIKIYSFSNRIVLCKLNFFS
jgi:hypothetical protein